MSVHADVLRNMFAELALNWLLYMEILLSSGQQPSCVHASADQIVLMTVYIASHV